MEISTKDIEQIIDLIGKQGLGFFALYIVYHYANQLMGTITLLVLAKKVLNIIESWLSRYLDVK